MTEDGDKYKLEIFDLKSCDGGEYMVKLENSIGEITQKARLNVSSKLALQMSNQHFLRVSSYTNKIIYATNIT